MKSNWIRAGTILLLLGLALPVAADNSEFRLLVSDNSAVVGGDFNVDLQIKVADGSTSPRSLNSLTVDVEYGSFLSVYTDTCAVNWALSPGYEATVSKLAGYYRVLVTANGVPGSGAAWPVTNSWQRLVTLRWKIATVTGSYPMAMSTITDAAAFFSAAPPSDLTEWATAPKAAADLKLNAKLFLQGPYSTSNDAMSTALRNGNYIPLTSPYGSDSRTLTDIPLTITDWIFLQLRSAATGATVASKSVLLRSDGQVVADNGTSAEIVIPSLEGEKDYYLVARHRNHLGVMSSSTLALNQTTATAYDFTTGVAKFYGNDAKNLEVGVYGLYSGDANQDGYVSASDKNLYWLAQRGQQGYLSGDFSLDTYVSASDKNIFWLANRGKSTNIP